MHCFLGHIKTLLLKEFVLQPVTAKVRFEEFNFLVGVRFAVKTECDFSVVERSVAVIFANRVR